MCLNYRQVLETARQVASFPVSSLPIPYDQMKSQCEALVTGKQQKMSVLQSFKHKQESKAIVLSDQNEKKLPSRVSKFVLEIEELISSRFSLIMVIRSGLCRK